MKDTLLSIVVILATFIGLPLLIVLLKDRFAAFGSVIKVLFGFLALAFGLVILGWIVYNLFHPTPYFFGNTHSPFAYLVPIVLIWFGWKWLHDGGPKIEATLIEDDAPEMHEATQAARDTLPFFIEQVMAGAAEASIKFPFVTDTDETEHVWGEVQAYADHRFYVEMISEPVTQEAPFDRQCVVAEADVEDWMFVQSDGRIKGYFSMIGAARYLRRTGGKITRAMQEQLARLVDGGDV
jgi:uncharacterized protein YegJ (DUF2314 family)